jgi:hypothetical protein
MEMVIHQHSPNSLLEGVSLMDWRISARWKLVRDDTMNIKAIVWDKDTGSEET